MNIKALCLAELVCVLGIVSVVQSQQGGNELQEKLAAVKQSAAENQKALRQYQWIETTQVSLKGEVKSTKQATCLYGSDGKVQKVPMATAPPPPPSGGRLKQKIVANKKEELTDYMESAKNLIGLYVPPNPDKMQQAFQAGNASLSGTQTAGVIELIFKNYVLPGDSMTLSFLSSAKKLTSVNVNSYLNDPKDVVSLSVQFASLPDGTSYSSQVVLVAEAKQTQVTVTNSNYQKISQ